MISKYVDMNPTEKKLVKIYFSVGQIANSGALQPSTGKSDNFLLLNLQFPKDGQQFYTKPCQMIHVIPINES